MAKQPEVIDRFRVWAEIPRDQLGEIVAIFTKMGLEHIGHELITDVLTFKQPKKFDINSVEFLRDWLKDHPTFTLAELKAHFMGAGRSKDSAYSSIYALIKEKVLRKLSPGNYQRADVKAIAGPKKTVKAKGNGKAVGKAVRIIAPKQRGSQPGRKPSPRNYAVSNNDLLMRKFRDRKKFTVKQAEDYFEENNRPRKSVWPILHNLEKVHKLRRLAQGEYAVVKLKLSPPRSKLNGAAGEITPASSSTTEVVTNG